MFSLLGKTILIAQNNLDTTKIELAHAEEIFYKNNLQLLAAKFNVSAADAAIIQAKLWSNPNISIEQNIYNQTTKRYFDFTSTGNTELQIQQLILLAGKRGKQVQLANYNRDIAELNFTDLLRTLKTQLRTEFYDLYYLQQSLKFYDESIPSLKMAINSVEQVYSKRSILLSEVLRLKSLLFSLETERLGIVNQILELQTDLKILMNETDHKSQYLVPDFNQEIIRKADLSNLDLDYIINLALEKRPDLKIAETNVKSETTNLNLQKALAVPDVTVGGRWSRAGSYIPDYYALTFSIDLPIFNRNQGNIAVSQNTLEANNKLRDIAKLNVEREVSIAFNKANEIDKLYKSFDKKFTSEYKNLVGGMISNYEKRYITIIEFTDFYESYRNSVLQTNQLLSNRIDAFENLNFKAGADVIKLN